MYIHIGDAVNNQDRGTRNILHDLNNEVEGYQNAHNVWESIFNIKTKDPLEFIRILIESENKIIHRQKELPCQQKFLNGAMMP